MSDVELGEIGSARTERDHFQCKLSHFQAELASSTLFATRHRNTNVFDTYEALPSALVPSTIFLLFSG
jgi:hypothetical protein